MWLAPLAVLTLLMFALSWLLRRRDRRQRAARPFSGTP
jgi:cytochrome c-type biogenesis protein CcmH/NrfF